jgi:hypothetical protein
VTACEGNRPALPEVLAFELRSGAFPGSGHPDVGVHVPAGFDASRQPGVVLYFHGWNGCVAASLGNEDAPCSEDGDPRTASGLAEQIDQAHVNALLVAVELRVDLPTGEPGQLAMPGALHELLSELFSEHLAGPLGCMLDVDALDRIVVIAHSGGYQAAASAIRYGGLAQMSEVVLLDSLYGADDVFAEWVEQAAESAGARLRFVDLYTSAGGTVDRSRTLAAVARRAAGGFTGVVYDDDAILGTPLDLSAAGRSATNLSDGALAQRLARPVVFQRVPLEHSQLPRAYFRTLVRAAGFAPLRATP